jgi:polyhydroxybutyrate depolymerase
MALSSTDYFGHRRAVTSPRFLATFALLALAAVLAGGWGFDPSAGPERINLADGRSALFAGTDREAPVVIFLHAATGSAARAFRTSGFAPAAARLGLNIAFGDSRDGFWRFDGLNGASDRSDDAYVLGLRDALLARGYGWHGVYLAGVSNGGMIALQVACAHPGRFDGVAVISAGMPAAVGDTCRTMPPRAVVVAGEADPVVPIAGGVSVMPAIGSFWSLERLGAFLLGQGGCARFEIGRDTGVATTVMPIRAVDCRRSAAVHLFRVVDGGHDGLLRAVPPETILRAVRGEGPGLVLSGR